MIHWTAKLLSRLLTIDLWLHDTYLLTQLFITTLQLGLRLTFINDWMDVQFIIDSE